MNAKKFLKQQAEQDRKEILASDDEEFLRALQQQTTPNPKKRVPLRVWLPSLASAVAATVLVTCIAVFYPFGNDQPAVDSPAIDQPVVDQPAQVEYFDDNLVNSNSTLEELKRDVKEFDLQIDSALYTCTVKKYSDSISGDVLYYTASIEDFDTIYHIELVIVCNPNYKYKDFNFDKEPITATLTNYTISYLTSTTVDSEFGLEILHAKAQIQKGQEMIYVLNYSELLLSPDGTFLETLQSIVK